MGPTGHAADEGGHATLARDGTNEGRPVNREPRILMVEHLDATGSSASDLRQRAQLIKGLGAEVRMMALTTETADHDLQHGTTERRLQGIERLDEERGGDVVRRAATQWRADAVVWVSATPGGGDAARWLGTRMDAWWWPSGWSATRGTGTLPALVPGLTPGGAFVMEAERSRGPRLSLWDGPYALVASPLRAADLAAVIDGFARAEDQRDEVDLVVLDDPDPEFEALARTAGIVQRVHFVGRATREAEGAWFKHARIVFVGLEQPLSTGLVVRAMATGCPVLAVGAPAEPVREFLRQVGATWGREGLARLGWDTVAAALHRTPEVEHAIARGRAFVESADGARLAIRIAPWLERIGAQRQRAA